MAKHIKMPKHQTGRTVTTKTPYGSTSDMIVEDISIFENVELNDNQIILQDDEGYYITTKDRLDSGMGDPNRYASPKNRIKTKEG